MKNHPQLLDLQHDLDDIFPHTRDIAELMQHILDADGRNSCPLQGGKQHPAQGISQRNAVPLFQRADDESSVVAGFCLPLHFRCNHVT